MHDGPHDYVVIEFDAGWVTVCQYCGKEKTREEMLNDPQFLYGLHFGAGFMIPVLASWVIAVVILEVLRAL